MITFADTQWIVDRMDSVTHILLGGCIGYAMGGKRLGAVAFFVPAIAATLPDMDVFLHTGDVVESHLLHRTFMHSLVMVPVLAAAAWFPFALSPRFNLHWKLLYVMAFLACLSHPLLDACTSYGTMMLWPFSPTRFAWDLIAVVDLFFTVPLLGALVWCMWKRREGAARWALAWCVVYLGLAVWQHQRAMWAQERLIASRGERAEHARVLPQIGAILNYRSVYLVQGQVVADAIRVPWIGAARYRAGSSIAAVDASDLRPFPVGPRVADDFDGFAMFADGYVARVPGHPEVIGDMRYPLTVEGFDALWGVQFEEVAAPEWRTFPRMTFVGRVLRDLVVAKDFVPLPGK